MIYVMSGGTKLFAAIGVTYPAGATLTCTNGTKTLKANNTSGQWVFAVPEAGTWTVTATQGSSTKSQSVSITSVGQFEQVALSFELVLFADGALASGYSIAGGTYISPAIDLSQYSVMEVTARHVNAAASTDLRLGFSADPANVSPYAPLVAYLTFANSALSPTYTTQTLDLSGLGETMYFAYANSIMFSHSGNFVIVDGILTATSGSIQNHISKIVLR